MHILIKNEDGVNAPDLLALAHAIHPAGKVIVLSPDYNWSALGHVWIFRRLLRAYRRVFLPFRVKQVYFI